ncbi:MAG: HAD family hydrolase [Deltaproteobacteria bacterium]|nr:MAG: HAD family hydrolase [Deltaproteobacteria bacterium]
MSRFVFLDRDGTLVRDAGYTHRVEDCELLPGVVDGLRRLAQAGYRLAIVTNQSGIGRGYFRSADFEAFQRRLLQDLARAGISIEATYHCPHRPDAGCDCRTPEPGLLFRARDELGADLARSWVIGDSERDIELARRAGCAGAVRVPKNGAAEGAETPGTGAHSAPDLAAAAAKILERER